MALTWAFSVPYFEPDGVIHENPCGYPHEILTKIMENSDNVLKACDARGFEQLDEPPTYQKTMVCFSPTDLGVPARRPRQYIFFNLYPFVNKTMIDFETYFFRERYCDASVYFTAYKGMVEKELDSFVSERRQNTGTLAKDMRDLWNRSHHSSKEGYESHARQIGLCEVGADDQDIVWKHKFALINLNNGVDFTTSIHTDAVQSLLRGDNSKLYDLVSGRELCTPELWTIQGYPHAEIEDSCNISRRQQRCFIGNSMHLTQVNTFLCFSLLTTDKSVLRKMTGVEGNKKRQSMKQPCPQEEHDSGKKFRTEEF